jgi:hypothetical protein
MTKTEEKFLAKVAELNPDYNIVDSGFKNKVWALDSGNTLLCHDFGYEYTFTKKNGEQSATRKGSININSSYCGFCGEKFEK